MACSGDSTKLCGAGYRLSVTNDTTFSAPVFGARPAYNTWSLDSCYQDNVNGRTLPISVGTVGGASSMTVANCLDACTAAGYTTCGLEYYQECWGSNAVPSSSLVAAPAGDPLSAGCNYPCRGNSSEACGGANRILVYTNSIASTK